MEQEIGRKDIRLSFNTYDFLGYFVPGAILLSIILVFEFYLQRVFYNIKFKPMYNFINTIKSYFLGETSHWFFEIVILVLFVITCYSLGHVIASLSAFFIDRVLVGSALRYPYKILFNIKEENNVEHRLKLKKGIITFTILLNIFFISTLFINYSSFALLLFFLLILYLLNVLNCFSKSLSSLKSNDQKNNSSTDKKIIKWYNQLKEKNKLKFNWFMSGIDKFMNLFKTFLGIYEPYDENFINKFREAYRKVFKSELEEDSVKVYWYVRNYISEKNPFFNSLLNNWFNLYSFARNLSTSVYLSFFYLIVIININLNLNTNDSFFNYSYKILIYKFLIISLFILSLILLLRYYYLYYTYYNKYLFRTFYYLYNQESNRTSN